MVLAHQRRSQQYNLAVERERIVIVADRDR